MSEESSMYSGAVGKLLGDASRTRGHLRSSLTLPLAQVVAVDARLAGDEALGELGLGHLEAEQRDRAWSCLDAARRSRRCW